MGQEATGRIQIIKVPEGEAPPWVRQMWVGLILNCFPTMGFCGPCCLNRGSADQMEKGVISGKSASQNRIGVCVPQKEAIEILERNSPPAVIAWWKNHGFPRPDECFKFGEDEVKIISGVIHASIIRAPSDMLNSLV